VTGRGPVPAACWPGFYTPGLCNHRDMTHPVYPAATAEIAGRRKELAPGPHDAFQEFSRQVFADGALDQKTKQLIAVAVAHVTQCPYCIQGHTKLAKRKGASSEEIMEAIWVAAEMRAGGAYAHSLISLTAMEEEHEHSTRIEPR
jgi:AhpD family alkylhydroperoxidase